MATQDNIDRINESAMDLARVSAMENGWHISDPVIELAIKMGIRCGSMATFEHIQRQREHRNGK